MSAKRRRKPVRPSESSGSRFTRRPTKVKSQQRSEGGWELVHPRCARERVDDIEEVQAMLGAGELEIARDELRWLLNDCSDFIDAHRLLGEIALEDEDYRLGRGHFGYAFEIGYSAMPQGATVELPYKFPANQSLLESAKGLAWCLHKLNKTSMAIPVVEQLLQWDPSDPLGVRAWLIEWRAT